MKDNIYLSDAEDFDVFYLERNNVPGVCVESKLNKSLSWTPIKISRHQIQAVKDSSDPSDDDDDYYFMYCPLPHCTSLDVYYQTTIIIS